MNEFWYFNFIIKKLKNKTSYREELVTQANM